MSPRTIAGGALSSLLWAGVASAQLPPVLTPPENPITEPKRVLGKILFWDAQLSSDNTTACGTCHIPDQGGADPRTAVHPGLDGAPGTADDKLSTLGVIRSDALDQYLPDVVFWLEKQATVRSSPDMITAQFSPLLFWDGRATGQFIDPETGQVAIASGGALESQAASPPISAVEMAHELRDWGQITPKLAAARPLALTTNVPPDAAAAIALDPTYPELFAEAFGDPTISARRIAFAIATYERTLVANQTPFDTGSLTPQQQAGLNAFLAPGARCIFCHTPPLFTNNTFRNIGLRPIIEDNGRQAITGNLADGGRFKVPTLRNAGLKPRFMHNGQLSSMSEVIDFYLEINGQVQFLNNQDPLIPPIAIPPQARPNLIAFLEDGLTDPRVANETFPFDRPTLHTELAANPAVVGSAIPGEGGSVPRIIAVCPPNLGNASFKIGIDSVLGGSTAMIALSRTPPDLDGAIDAYDVVGPIALGGAGAGEGYGTWAWPVPDDEALLGDRLYVQWLVNDPSAPGGVARSEAAALTFYRDDPTQCGCHGDLNCDATVGFDDLVNVLLHWGTCTLCGADISDDGNVGFDDLTTMILAWGECP